jgi:hypothetical protein
MAALAFLRGYSQLELMIVAFVAVVVLSLLGMLANAILGPRGFGILGNGIVIGAGGAVAIAVHDWLVRQPDFAAFGWQDRAVLISLAAACATMLLLLAASLKRYFS